MKMVIFPAVEPARWEAIRAAAGSTMQVVNAQTSGEAMAAIAGADAFFGKMTPELLGAATRLRWIQTPTASLEHYLFPALVEHPLTLTNMRGLFSDVIADHVMGYVLCFARNLHTYVRRQLEQRYEPVGGEEARSNFVSGPGVVSTIDLAHPHLADQTMGIVGLGAIGSEIARRAQAFGMRTIAVDPVSQSAWPMERLPELLAESDYVAIAAPHTPKTEGLFGAAQFARMKPSAYLINIGRGAIVQLDALVEALRAKQIAGAGLDVFEIEPLPAGHPLWQFPNVIITPHIAGTSPRIAERHLGVVVENVRRFAAGEPLTNVANKREWY
jgi:phosphoglycerate dehydrogenase-like enzyme